ncbi:IclR family transcriptional regulator [Pseudooceanicola sp.]|uniref:IclR family transcriptional regulator n=1 Tax=Pseudooceanicola sp. TaxID=1914328 RepID=UPI0035C6FA81
MPEQTREPVKRAVPAVSRAVAILRYLGRSEDPVGVNPMARDLGLVPSTCLHILRVLTDEGLVHVDPQTKRYTIGVGILPIARTAIQRNAFISLVQPHLDHLSELSGATLLATQVTEAGQMVVVALSQVPQRFSLSVELGSRFPLLISATGRCYAAFSGLDEESLRKGFARLHWDNPPRFDAWIQQIADARAQGYAVDSGAYMSGVTVVAVPFLNAGGRMTRSLVAVGISERMAAHGIDGLAQEMMRAREEIDALSLAPQG